MSVLLKDHVPQYLAVHMIQSTCAYFPLSLVTCTLVQKDLVGCRTQQCSQLGQSQQSPSPFRGHLVIGPACFFLMAAERLNSPSAGFQTPQKRKIKSQRAYSQAVVITKICHSLQRTNPTCCSWGCSAATPHPHLLKELLWKISSSFFRKTHGTTGAF